MKARGILEQIPADNPSGQNTYRLYDEDVFFVIPTTVLFRNLSDQVFCKIEQTAMILSIF